jgi:hypothetical protein
MPSISLQCPSCGRHNDDVEKQCECGFVNDKSVIAELEEKGSDVVKSKSLKNIDAPKNNKHTKQLVVKEIDSWVFTLSQEENCINLGTPALKAFTLKLTLEDLEELLESVYRALGKQKTIRKLHISTEALPDLIEEVNRLIEEKRSKMSIKFDKGELQGIAELINKKLEE